MAAILKAARPLAPEVSRHQHKANQIAGSRSIQDRPDPSRRVEKVGEVARRQIGSKVIEALRQHRRVRVELAPKMQTAIPRVVHFKHKAVPDLSLETKVGL